MDKKRWVPLQHSIWLMFRGPVFYNSQNYGLNFLINWGWWKERIVYLWLIYIQDCENGTFWPTILILHTPGMTKCSKLINSSVSTERCYVRLQTVCKFMFLTSVDFRESGRSMRNWVSHGKGVTGHVIEMSSKYYTWWRFSWSLTLFVKSMLRVRNRNVA